jgi:GNAT superfamily N-acetyltransferase
MRTWTISNLAHVPQFADTIADRGWHAWWTTSGVPLTDYRAHLNPMLEGSVLPLAFVAHRQETYLGSALLIENDLSERPNLSPWIAALWVDPDYRGQGIAAELMSAARVKATTMGVEKVYLCAEPKVTNYYLANGWTQIETEVGGLNVFEMFTS